MDLHASIHNMTVNPNRKQSTQVLANTLKLSHKVGFLDTFSFGIPDLELKEFFTHMLQKQ